MFLGCNKDVFIPKKQTFPLIIKCKSRLNTLNFYVKEFGSLDKALKDIQSTSQQNLLKCPHSGIKYTIKGDWIFDSIVHRHNDVLMFGLNYKTGKVFSYSKEQQENGTQPNWYNTKTD